MINDWEDYYQILQVHFMADPDIIKSAYLRLSKKYHPDSNNVLRSEEKMKSINKAYAILSKTDTRNEYDMRWVKRFGVYHNNINNISPSEREKIHIESVQEVLSNYLTKISRREYEHAYKLLTNHDKSMISGKEFTQWQSLVGEIFELISFTCEFDSMYKEVKINNQRFDTCIKMHVKVIEENRLMERLEEDEFYKNIVYENGTWRIYLGYNNLKGIIDKFNALSLLNRQKNESIYYTKPFRRSKKDFIQMAQREQMRFNRYGNLFTVIACKINDRSIEDMDEIMNKLLRKLDLTCRWNKNTHVILLPETDEEAAQMVANKIHIAMKENINKKKEVLITFHIVQQQYATFEDLMIRVLNE
jgi:curved DNA-binding protein CbpA